MQDSDIATAADYADAMLVARRAKSTLVLLLILVLLGQLSLFFLVKYEVIPLGPVATTIATTEPATTQPTVDWGDLLQYLTAAQLGLGLVLTIVLSFVLLLIVNIMIVGRLIGVARLTSAYIWCLILLALIFPWQAFFGNMGSDMDMGSWKWPGVLYTWQELKHPTHGALFTNEFSRFAILKWVRFVGVPVFSLLILLAIQVKSNRGLRQALGEEQVLEPGSP